MKITHGLWGRFRREHKIWCGMHTRCHNIRHKNWRDYGGRGITIAPEWYGFESFLRDMGPRPSPQHSINRINNDWGYFPENCRWATSQEQSANRRPFKPRNAAVPARKIAAQKLAALGFSQRQIANMVGASQSTVGRDLTEIGGALRRDIK